MSNYLSLEEAAKRLGLTPDVLVEFISKREIHGYRDGSSWKFKLEEIERFQADRDGIMEEDPSGSSLLLSDVHLGSSLGSAIGSDINLGKPESDLRPKAGEGSDSTGSDVALVADPNSGSGVRLVTRNTPTSSGDSSKKLVSRDSDDDLKIIDEDGLLHTDGSGSAIDIGSDLMLASGSGSAISLSDVDASGISLSPVHSSDVLADSDAKLKLGSTGASGTGASKIGSSGSLNLDDDLQIAADDEDDLVLGSGSDLALAADSGINLMSPSDSGLALDDEPLDLAGTGISGLDLAAEGSDASLSGSASGSLVDFQQDEEFQLTPSGGMDMDEDSGSQVIELEDSTDFGNADLALPDAGMGFGDDAGLASFGGGDDGMGGLGGLGGAEGTGAAAAARYVPDIQFDILHLCLLMTSLLLLGLSGLVVTDLFRNMWAWNETESTDLTTGLVKALVSITPKF